MRSTRRSMIASTSISSVTPRQSPAFCARRMSSWFIHRFRPKLFQSSSPMQKPIRAITWASPGVGTAGHVCGELFKMMAGLNMLHVPYRGGGAAMADLLSGQLQVYIGAITSSLEYVKANRLRALAVSTATRSEALPEVARVSDFVSGFETSDWGGISGPKATPAEIVDQLNKEVNAALDDPKMKTRLADLGGTPLPGSPAQFGKLIAEETEKWGKVIRAANIKPQG